MPQVPSLIELLKTGAHFGHQVSKWHPKMKPFLFGNRNGIHIINLEKTVEIMATTLAAARDIVAKGGTILFVGTKRQARELVERHAKECKMPYVIDRWLGGTFTNFPEMSRLIRKYNDHVTKRDKGDFDKYTKKERVVLDRAIADMSRKVGGIATLSKLPEAVYIVDIKHEKTALTEANDKKVPVFAMTDSNVNPEQVTYGVPMNDDAMKAIEMMTRLMAEAVNEGLKIRETQKAAAVASPSAKASGDKPEEKTRILTA
jgi:small subunit ribosomal protein S2